VTRRAVLADVSFGNGLPVGVMGVLNVSPESFHAGSVHVAADDLLSTALAMVEVGAVLIDIGARSTAPYLDTDISEEEERARLARAIDALAPKLPVPISADTARPGPARAALEAGARIINDVSGLRNPALASLTAERGVGVILMASPGRPEPPRAAEGPVAIVSALLKAALKRARAAGIPDERVMLDPGIGFFRSEAVPWDEWDSQVLAGLAGLEKLRRPLCVGVSRKSFIGEIIGRVGTEARLAGSLAATAIAVANGASLIRTHDVAETIDAVRVAERIRRASAAL
jgi:dihydropteroate synthase